VQGDLYRLISPRDGSKFSASETVAADKSQAVGFAFANSTEEGRGFPLLELQGSIARRSTSSLDRRQSISGHAEVASGDWWMHHGIQLDLRATSRLQRFAWIDSTRLRRQSALPDRFKIIPAGEDWDPPASRHREPATGRS